MEPAGILKCFMRSVEQLNLRFINFIGNGDSKAYYEVVKANPYGDRYPVNKAECLGHIQTRVGSRLRKLRKEYGGKKLSGLEDTTWSSRWQRNKQATKLFPDNDSCKLSFGHSYAESYRCYGIPL